MKAATRALILAYTALLSAPTHAEELSVSAVKAFMARIDTAFANGDFEVIGRHMAEHAIVSGTNTAGGQLQPFRMTKSQYLTAVTVVRSAASSYAYERTNEKISIDGDQATITADVTESVVLNGRTMNTQARERATVESIDGVLMLTQVVANTTAL